MRLLVVEDEKKLAFAIDEGLQRAGYTVDLVFDGDEALHYARCAAYDAIVLDVLLPKLNGLEACRRLRASLRHDRKPAPGGRREHAAIRCGGSRRKHDRVAGPGRAVRANHCAVGARRPIMIGSPSRRPQ